MQQLLKQKIVKDIQSQVALKILVNHFKFPMNH